MKQSTINFFTKKNLDTVFHPTIIKKIKNTRMKIFIATVCSFFTYLVANAQSLETYVHSAEYGVSVGAAHYFGDLNPDASISHPKFSAGIFFQKQFNNYIGLRISGNYAFLGYSDKYSNNEAQKIRNLSFNTDVWEMNVAGYFNFFKFNPQLPEHRFTPYISVGIGAFSFNPYAYLSEQKFYLQPLGTEGQGSATDSAAGKPYSTIAVCIPFGVGFKYAINEKINVFAEVVYRFTTAKYLDDVSGTYHPNAYPQIDETTNNFTSWYLLQDRSYETRGQGSQIGTQGFQRGNGVSDSYATFQIGISFNIQSYKCAQP
jgi:hypothetical protein